MPDSALARLGEELVRWKELLGGTIIAFLALIWRLGRKEQQREHRISDLECWRDEHVQYSQENKSTIEGISAHLGQQDVRMASISQQAANLQANLVDMREDIRALSGLRQPGGKRCYDPPPEPSKFCTEEDEDEEEDAAHAS